MSFCSGELCSALDTWQDGSGCDGICTIWGVRGCRVALLGLGRQGSLHGELGT